MKKELKKLIKKMKKEGWKISSGPSCHIKCKSPDGKRMISLPHTPSCNDYMYDIKRNLRKIGYEDLLVGILKQ